MEYRLKVGETIKTFWVEPHPSGVGWEVQPKDGGTHHLKGLRVNEYQWILERDGQAQTVFLAPDQTGKTIFLKGQTIQVSDADQEARVGSRRKSIETQPGMVTPPMPAMVVRLLTREGEVVIKGQGLVVVSAMKMETTLFAPYAGKVTRINTVIGNQVMPGEILVEIEPLDAHHE